MLFDSSKQQYTAPPLTRGEIIDLAIARLDAGWTPDCPDRDGEFCIITALSRGHREDGLAIARELGDWSGLFLIAWNRTASREQAIDLLNAFKRDTIKII